MLPERPKREGIMKNLLLLYTEKSGIGHSPISSYIYKKERRSVVLSLPDFVDEIEQYLKLTLKDEGEHFSIPIFRAFPKNQAARVHLKGASIYI